jgi:hypothetical protein
MADDAQRDMRLARRVLLLWALMGLILGLLLRPRDRVAD